MPCFVFRCCLVCPSLPIASGMWFFSCNVDGGVPCCLGGYERWSLRRTRLITPWLDSVRAGLCLPVSVPCHARPRASSQLQRHVIDMSTFCTKDAQAYQRLLMAADICKCELATEGSNFVRDGSSDQLIFHFRHCHRQLVTVTHSSSYGTK